jgi:HD superfamily phosphohydrolase
MYHYIEKKREEVQSLRVSAAKKATPKRLINAEAEDRHFSFHEVKDHIEKINDFNEKLIYLTEEIFEYKQADIISVNNKLQAYDEQCSQLIEKLQTIRKMKSEFEKEKELTENNPGSGAAQHVKLQINGPINILTNAFKQMMVNVKPNGTPYIQYKIKDVAQFICDNFVDENGQPISQATIQTYLSPNRTDKDPNSDSVVRF